MQFNINSTPKPKRFHTWNGAFLFIGLLASLFFIFNFKAEVLAQTLSAAEERASLERQLEEFESQISDYEKTLAVYKNQGQSLSSEITRLNAKVSKLNLQIKAVNLSLKKLDGEISEKVAKITDTKQKIDFNKDALSEALQANYESSNTGLVQVLLENPKLSDFFGGINHLLQIQQSLAITINRITDLKNQLSDEKEILALKRSDTAKLKEYQDAQKNEVEQSKKEKDSILKVTKGKESEYQKLIKETQKTAAQIRNRIFELLGGGKLTFEEAYEFAKFAGNAVGLRPSLILAVLDRESSLGENVGRCKYNKNPYYPERAQNPTSMHPTRDIPKFLELTATLGLNPETTLISCPIPQDGAYGGGMGPAQFIPSTWYIYKEKIKEITSSNPASPWKNSDAFAGTALYLKDAYSSRDCVNYGAKIPAESVRLQERCAAAKYYAGGRWYSYRFAYGEPVVDRADSFDRDIQILNS